MSAPEKETSAFARPLRNLLQALGRQGNEHLTEVEADLHQTSYLLIEAIAKLGNSFMGIHAATSAQRDLIVAIQEGTPVSSSLCAQIDELQQQATACVNEAITALQFQDMTNQLIGRIVGHVASLHQVLHGAGQAGALLPDTATDSQALEMLQALDQTLREKSTILEQAPCRAVTQTHMESGDIELF